MLAEARVRKSSGSGPGEVPVPEPKRLYLFTGGGTGGHVTPNLAIMDELKGLEPEARFLYVGSAHGYEARLPNSGIETIAVSCAQFTSPRRPLRFALMALKLLLGTIQSFFICIRRRPAVVMATGGYVSVPVVLGAFLARRRIFLHEQNVEPGKANRFLAFFATRVGTSFAETVARFPRGKSFHTGYPVRRKVFEGNADRAREALGIARDAKVVFFVGGSMGARSINRGVVEGLKTLLKGEKVAVIQSTGLATTGEYQAFEDTRVRLHGEGFETEVRGRFICRDFFQEIGDVYAMADLVVARSGAGTVMELAALGKPCVLVPKTDAPGDHQHLNALALERTGAAKVLLEERTDDGTQRITRVRGDQLAGTVLDLLSDPPTLQRMARRAERANLSDALSVNAGMLRKLAAGEPLIETVTEKVRIGTLLDSKGQAHELIFRSTTIGTSPLADVRASSSTGAARAIVLRMRQDKATEFHLLPRRGRIEVNGKPARERTRLRVEDVLTVGDDRFTLIVNDREVKQQVDSSGISVQVAVTSVGTLVSRVAGFAREAVAVAVLGLGNVMDIMALGLGVTNYLRGVFAEVAVDTAFMPTYIHLARTGRRADANRLFSTMLLLTVLLAGGLTVAAIWTMPRWLGLIAPGFVERGLIDEAVATTRLMFPYLVLVAVAALFGAVLKSCNRFAVPAFSSVMFSFGVLAGTLLYPWFGLTGLALGVLLGGLGQVLIQVPTLLSPEVRGGYGVRLRPAFALRDPGVRKVGLVTPNILADVSISKCSAIVDSILATPLGAGSISALYVGMVVFQLPFGLISQSINTVVLKELSEGQATGDRERTRRLLADGVNWTVFLLLPISVAMAVLAEPIVRLLFGYGAGAGQLGNVVLVLRFYAIGLTGWGLTALLGRFFSARMEQWTSTATSLGGLVFNIALSITFVKLGMGVAGIALGTSIAFTVNGLLRLVMLQRSLRAEGGALKASDVLPSLLQTVTATLGSVIAMLLVWQAVRDFHALPEVLNRIFILAVPVAFGAFAFAAIGVVVRSEQIEEVLLRLNRRRSPSGGGSGPVNPYCISPESLLRFVQNNREAAKNYNLARRTAELLENSAWQTRNTGVKLVGELGFTSFRQKLCEMATCRVPAPRWERLLGGDFRQPGFVRRNALESLEKLGDVDVHVERTLLASLEDPYFEVRTRAAGMLGRIAERMSGAGLEQAAVRLQKLALNEGHIEVLVAVVRSIGSVARDEGAVEILRKLHYHANWMVRDAVVEAYDKLVRRGLLAPTRALALLDDVLITSDGFEPRFRIKERIMNAQHLCAPRDTPRAPTQATRAREQGAS